MTKESPILDFIKKNAWSLLVSLVIIGSYAAMIQLRIDDALAQTEELRGDVDRLTSLVERVIILEQREERLQEDVKEIKDDVKTILRNQGIE